MCVGVGVGVGVGAGADSLDLGQIVQIYNKKVSTCFPIQARLGWDVGMGIGLNIGLESVKTM